jgi:hypothetical protein
MTSAPARRGGRGTAAELRDQLLVQAVAEVLMALVAEVAEGEHGEPHEGARLDGRRRRVGCRGRGHEAIAAPRQCFDEAWTVGVVTERGAEALHRGVQAVLEVYVRAVRPELPPQLLPGHHFARPLQQQAKDFEGLILQPYPRRARPQLPRALVELECTEPEGAVDPACVSTRAPFDDYPRFRSRIAARHQMSPTCHLRSGPVH